MNDEARMALLARHMELWNELTEYENYLAPLRAELNGIELAIITDLRQEWVAKRVFDWDIGMCQPKSAWRD